MSSGSTAGSAPTRRPRGPRAQADGPIRRHRRGWGQFGVAMAFLAPAIVALVLLRLLPAVWALATSLFHQSFVQGGLVWVGFGNYIALFSSPGFLQSVGVTLLFTLLVNPIQIAIAFVLAVLYTRRFAGSKFWRSLVILPVAAPGAVTTVIWSVIYRPDGLGNALLGMFGIPHQPFLTSAGQSLLSIIILLSWGGVGYWMLFLIAGLNDVPTEYYEAASLDGASRWRQMWQITLPLVRRPLAFVLVADTVANFLIFAPVQILTQGGPNGSTNLLMYDIYSRAYTLDDIGGADAEVVILVLVTLLIVALQFRLLRSDE